jgi:hypothetical protein
VYIFARMMSRRLRRTSQVLSLAAVAVVSALLAASGAEAKKAKSKVPADAVECKQDTDCVAVSVDCCSCHEGGKQRAIPKKDQALYDKEQKKRCGGTACTEVMSQDPSCSQKPFCAAGICELADAPAP